MEQNEDSEGKPTIMSANNKKEVALSITKTYDLQKPAEAVQMAVLLKNIVVQQKLFVPIKGKNYAVVEAWQLAGFLTGMSVKVDEPKNLSTDKGEIKYSATARIYQGDKEIAVGYAVCSSKESLKKGFDEYAILSMAQTRAIGKAYRNKIGFIMKLAGFNSTPAEEMHKVGDTPAEPVAVPENPGADESQEPKHICTKCDVPIPEVVANYSQKVYGKKLCRDCQKDVKKK
jgi:hypothetical protein